MGFSKKVKGPFTTSPKEVNISWAARKYYKHLPVGKIRAYKLFNKRFYFCSGIELLHGLKEIFIDQIYKQELQERPYIIDCGANVGMSIIYMKQHFPQAEIIAFEPDDTNFELLTKNIQSFGYSGVSLYKQAVWNENTTLLFSNDSTMSSKIENNATANAKKVPAVRLKDFIVKDIDFLKIDIEGAENTVLTDIAANLHFVKNMFFEYHGTFDQNSELVKMINIIKESGFNFYIKEASSVYSTPFLRSKNTRTPYDLQLNIFCFRK